MSGSVFFLVVRCKNIDFLLLVVAALAEAERDAQLAAMDVRQIILTVF